MVPPAFAEGGVYLALETSGSIGSVAVGSFGEGRERSSSALTILAERALGRPGDFGAELVPAVAAVLARAGKARDQLAGIVVGSGPGSFTGVRLGAATAKGIAHALGIPLWAFSSLECAAAAETDGLWCVLFDARADRLYAACYRVGGDSVEKLVAPHATTLDALVESELPADAVLVGDGALRHEAALRAAGHVLLPPPAGVPTAKALLRLLGLHPHRVESFDGWEPDYVKASSAERPRVG